MSLGLLRAAWRPDGEVCVVRAVARRREVLITEQASWFQPMQKALVQMNIQLTKVLRDVMGQTGQTIICAIVAGERDPQVLARHCNGRVKASVAETAARGRGRRSNRQFFVGSDSVRKLDRSGPPDRQSNLGDIPESIAGRGAQTSISVK